MEQSFWHARWSENKIGFHQEKVNSRLIKFWPALDLPPHSQVFVPLCGKSRDLLWLADQGFNVVGVELSKTACAQFFSKNNLAAEQTSDDRFERFRARTKNGATITLYAGDFFDLDPDMLANVTGVFDRAALIALPPPMRIRYADRLRQILPANSSTLLISMEYDESKMTGPPFSVSEQEVRKLFGEEFNVALLTESSGPDIVGNLKERGLDELHEQVFRLTRHAHRS